MIPLPVPRTPPHAPPLNISEQGLLASLSALLTWYSDYVTYLRQDNQDLWTTIQNNSALEEAYLQVRRRRSVDAFQELFSHAANVHRDDTR